MSGKAVGRCLRGSMAQESEQEEITAQGTEQACVSSSGSVQCYQAGRGRRHRGKHESLDWPSRPHDGEGDQLCRRFGFRPSLRAGRRGAGPSIWEGPGRGSQRAFWIRHGTVPPLEDRLRMLEENLEAMRGSLAAIAGEARGGGRAVPLPAKPSPKPAPAPKDLPGMDPTTVRAALQAGIPAHHLEEMAKIMRTRPARLEDVPRKSALKKPAQGGALGETEDEEEDGEVELIPDVSGSAGGPQNKDLEAAIIQLTTIASKLTGGEVKKDKLDQILDGGGGSGSHADGSSHPTSRKNSVALRALQRCLRDDPKYLYQVVEANLQGDFLGRAASAGEPRVPGTTVRGWLTSKSRIQNYQQHVRWCWALGGIWDALIEGRAEEARARCALMMCAADQAAIDGGNWLMSTVALLEPVPPYQQFANHLAPGPAEPQYSMLYDPRWAEIFLTHLKEVDSFVDTKKKLGGRGSGKTETEEEKTARAKAAAAKAKSKAERAERARAQRTGGSEGGGGG